MAPSGAGRAPVGCLFLFLLAALGWVRAESNVTSQTDSLCLSIDDQMAAALSPGVLQPNVTLGPGCHVLTRNFACTPIQRTMSIVGSEDTISTWDTDFDLYQFSVEPGVVVILRNLVLSRALVFTSVDSERRPSAAGDSRVLQPSIFHMRANSSMVLQNVVVQTRCATLTFYWNNFPGLQPVASVTPPPPLAFGNVTMGAVTLQNVTVRCDPGLELSSPVDLYVHTVPMLKAFLAASSALSIQATFHVMENLTLPQMPPSSSSSAELSDVRDWLVTADTTITGAGDLLTYVDSNFTASWLRVQWPARLTLRNLVLTRLYVTVTIPSGGNGLLAGGLPLSMLQVTGTPTQTARYFKGVTLIVPQYEILEMTYWCVMFGVATPEVKHVADFLRPYVWPNDFDILDQRRLLLTRVRTVSSMYENVLLTSQPPPNVPVSTAGLPTSVLTYPHVQPPLFYVTNGKDWADAVAPILPRDTWSNLPPAVGSPQLAASSGDSGGVLPALVLINGTVVLQPSDVQATRSGGVRVVRRSVVITSVRQGCSAGDPACPPAVLDMAGLQGAMRLEGLNTTVVFVGITLRNVPTTLSMQTLSAATADINTIGGFFSYDRTSVHVSMESVTVEIAAIAFAGLYRLITVKPRGGKAGDVNVISISENLIQLANFQFGGVRGNYVNFTTVGNASAILSQEDDVTGHSAHSASSKTVPIAVGVAVGGGCALLLAVGALWLRRVQRWRSYGGPASGRGKAPGDSPGGTGHDLQSTSTTRSIGADVYQGHGAKSGSSFTDVLYSKGKDAGGDASAARAAGPAAAAAAATELTQVCDQVKISDEESPQCTTLIISDLNSSETTTALQVVQQMVPVPPPMPLSLPGVSGQMPRRAFSLARSVPEEDELEGEASMDSSRREDGTSRGSGCSTSAGGIGQRLLMDAAGASEAVMAAAAAAVGLNHRNMHRVLPSLLDPPADVSSRGSGGGSGASARRMMRMASGGRMHLYGSGEPGRPLGLRVRAALGRSPSRPARSTASSSGGPSNNLAAPQPALLVAPSSPSMLAAVPSTAPPRMRAERLYYYSQNPHLRDGGGGAHRREASHPMIIGGAGAAVGAAAAGAVSGMVTGNSACAELLGGEATASHSTQLIATGGTLDPLSGPNLDPDILSPGGSASLSKVPEPASEVQKLIQELSMNGTDQLVILEPIGQGGYGMVYRGVWRNLDVAVKTVLFQDRANLASPQLSCPASVSLQNNCHILQASVIEKDEESPQKLSIPLRGLCSSDGPQGCSSRPASTLIPSQPMQPLLATKGAPPASWVGTPAAAAAAATATAVGCGRDAQANGSGAGGTHNFALASQQAANSGSLPSVNIAGAAAPGVASQQRAVLEAAVSCSVAHPNVVATYHYDIAPIRPSGVVCSGGLLISDGSHMRVGCGGPNGGCLNGPGAVSDWKLYLVQEFCDAGSLANALDARAFHDPAGMPNLALTLCALADIARGMAHIHSRSIVHGDLNPTNILLRSVAGSNGGIVPMWNRVAMANGSNVGGNGSGNMTPAGACVGTAAQLRNELGVALVAKVADFGLCGMLAPGKRHISNALRGTPFYTAPETVATGTLTKASDVYSFGVIAWEVYTGRPPFQHVPDQGFVRDESFPRLPSHVPKTFGNMTLACVSNDPDARPTFDQILDRLMSLQSKLAVSLQQRLTRLMGSGAPFLGAASPLGPGTAATTPLGSATPTSLGPGLPYSWAGNGIGRHVSKQPASIPSQQVCAVGMAGGMGIGLGVSTAGLTSDGIGNAGLLGSCAGVPNFPLSTPCILPAAASQSIATEAGGQ